MARPQNRCQSPFSELSCMINIGLVMSSRFSAQLLCTSAISALLRRAQCRTACSRRGFSALPAKPEFTVSCRYAEASCCDNLFKRLRSSSLAASAAQGTRAAATYSGSDFPALSKFDNRTSPFSGVTAISRPSSQSWQRPHSSGGLNINSVSFVSAPFSGGQPKAGAEYGPEAIFSG
jgi:hypothetical protein